jgi:hypothetical protein
VQKQARRRKREGERRRCRNRKGEREMTGGRYIRGSGRKLKEFQKVPASNKARRTAGMLTTLFLFPPIIIFLWYTLHSMDGSITRSYKQFHTRGWWKSTKDIWPLPTLRSAKLLVIFAAFQSILLLFLPGDQYAGPLSPAGNRPYFKVVTDIYFFFFFLSCVHQH